jgi:hypothetical protein
MVVADTLPQAVAAWNRRADRLEAFHAKPVVGERDAAAIHHGWTSYQNATLFASSGDLALVNNTAFLLAKQRAALQSPPPVVEEGRREAASYDTAYAQGGLDALNEVMGVMGCQDTDESPVYEAVEKRREYLRTMQADAKPATLALTPVEGAGEITDELRNNPEAIWLSPRCETNDGRTWANPAPDRKCDECGLPWVRYVRSDLTALSTPVAAQGDEDAKLLDALRDQSWDLRCFDIPTGGGDADVGWRVIGHYQSEPEERVIAEEDRDDPRAAIRTAIATLKDSSHEG